MSRPVCRLVPVVALCRHWPLKSCQGSPVLSFASPRSASAQRCRLSQYEAAPVELGPGHSRLTLCPHEGRRGPERPLSVRIRCRRLSLLPPRSRRGATCTARRPGLSAVSVDLAQLPQVQTSTQRLRDPVLRAGRLEQTSSIFWHQGCY
ncbi:hypothetical protein NDU88_000070 [Pleurodeles waltl]|uniref:Uncharacterized protein n=1 Tax=Pleurodeles waltl TaxID=8319 RepID=A0AAV7NB36_PLEWA|nr:hypothetical protein NDU88_000070 [Pleurodeles waltl]